MNSRYFICIFCAGAALLFLFGQTALEVLIFSRPADAPHLSILARIGVVLAALISATALLQLTVHLINSRFFPHHQIEDPLGREHLGAVLNTEQREEYPSRATIAQHEQSGDPLWEDQAKRLKNARQSQEPNRTPTHVLLEA